MHRRSFLLLLGSLTAAWPGAARAQQQRAKVPAIGFLGSGAPFSSSKWTAAFVQRLQDHGWAEGRTIMIEYRWAEGRNERYAEFAAEFVRLKVDVIVTTGTAALVARRATSEVPIVFTLGGDPVGNGLVASLARPGGNVTGVLTQQSDLAGKGVELLREVVPGLRPLALLANVSIPNVVLEAREAQAAARTLGLEVTTLEIRRAEDIAPAFETLKGSADTLFVAGDPLTAANRVRISTLAAAARLPTVYGPSKPEV